MQVAYLTDFLEKNSNPSVGTTKSLSQALKKQGVTARWLAPASRISNLNLFSLPSFKYKNFPIPLNTALTDQDLNQPDILHLYHPLGLAKVILNRPRNRPIVFSPTPAFFKSEEDLWDELNLRIAQQADLISVPSQFEAKNWRNKGLDTPIVVVPPLVEPNENLSHYWEIPQDKPWVVLGIDGVDPEALKLALRVMDRLAEKPYLVLVSGQSLANTHIEYLLGSHIYLIENASKMALDSLLEQAAVYLELASESLPLTALLAQTNATPVIALDEPVNREFLADHQASLLIKPTGSELNRALGDFLKNSPKRYRYGRRAKQLSSRFSPEKVAEKLIDSYVLAQNLYSNL